MRRVGRLVKVLKKLREKLLGRKAHIVHHDLKNFPFELDQKENLPRKGIQSMYIEAEKH